MIQTGFCSKKGSALIATITIVGAISLTLVGVGRLTFKELKISTSLEDSALAFAAAEAGIEDGLLRWRHNRNVELPAFSNGTPMSENVLRAIRVNLSRNEVPIEVGLGSAPTTPEESVYDLRIWYKAQKIGEASQLAEANYPYRLYKDQTFELNVSNLPDDSLTFTYQTPAGQATVARIEWRVVTELADGTLNEAPKLLTEPSLGREVTIPLTGAAQGQKRQVRIKPYLFAADGVTPAADTSYITYSLAPARVQSLIDSGVTVIESTGYFGSARRKLVAKIDRTSGTILGVFDYALYAQGQIR